MIIIPDSEILSLNSRIVSRNEYSINYNTGIFKLSPGLAYSLYDTLIIIYKTIDISLQREYKRRELVRKLNTGQEDSVVYVSKSVLELTSESIFGSNIEKSGSLTRGFSFGTNKDFSLSSGLRLQLSGKLSEDIEIIASLSDENTPIQPEGNTERLEELDKVFIQVKHPNAIGTFGDYQISRRNGEFGIVERKLQGLMTEFNYKDQSAFFSVASARGKFNTIYINGLEGVQGPYRLTGNNNEREIIILAGTEKVFVDGVQQKRGENNDYTIDYSNAEVTFTPRKLITSASRIYVDFEYTERRYERSFLSAGTTSSFFDNKVNLKLGFLREADDESKPIDLLFSETDKNQLVNSGDNRFSAVKSGASIALPDSLGRIRGSYLALDTLINNIPLTIYTYAPQDTNAKYNVVFSHVGDNQGDYTKESFNNYRFVGKNSGNYLPVIFLPLPELRQSGNVVLDLNPFKGFSLSMELAGSQYDRNRFSSLNDNDNSGWARNIQLKLDPTEIELGGNKYGKVGLTYKDRFIDERFTSPDRFNEVEYSRNYNLGLAPQDKGEQLREVALSYSPINEIANKTSYGYVERGENFKSNRFNNLLDAKFKNTSLTYLFDYVNTKTFNVKSFWYRQTAGVSHTILYFTPGADFLYEFKEDKNILNDSISPSGFRYYQFDPYLNITNLFGISLKGKFSYRIDQLPLNNDILTESKSYTQIYELNYNGIKEFNTNTTLTLRAKKYEKEFLDKGLLNSETILIRSQNRFALWNPLNGDFFYEVSTQRSSKRERIFIKVEKGAGNYRYIGDINNNGITEENEFEITPFEDGEYIISYIPTDRLYPVIDLKTSTRWKLDLNKVFSGESFFNKLMRSLSTETYWRIEENTREEDYSKIYLLNFSAFQNDINTIYGSNLIQQDVFIFEDDQELSFRLRFQQRRSLTQFAEGTERSYFRERSLRIKFKLVEEIGNQTDIAITTDRVSSNENISNRRRNITGNSITSDFSYRPINSLEVGFKVRVARNEDSYPERPTLLDINSQAIRINLSFAGAGRLRAEAERNELTANTKENYLPFELTQGNVLGKNYIWRLNFDYRITNNLQASAGYDGRIQGSRPIHTARAEVRASF